MWPSCLSDQNSRSCLCREISTATADLKLMLAWVFFFFFLSFFFYLLVRRPKMESPRRLGDFFLKRKFLLGISWAGGLGLGWGWGWLLLLPLSKELHCMRVR